MKKFFNARQIGCNIMLPPANDYVQSFVVDNLQTKIDSLRKFLT